MAKAKSPAYPATSPRERAMEGDVPALRQLLGRIEDDAKELALFSRLPDAFVPGLKQLALHAQRLHDFADGYAAAVKAKSSTRRA